MSDPGSILAGINAVGGFVNNAANQQMNERQFEQYIHQQAFANEFAIEGRRREDNAVQRRRADLEAAGLHPTLAVGGAAASTMQSPPPGSPQTHPLTRQQSVMESALGSRQLQQMAAQTELLKAEAHKTYAEADRTIQGKSIDLEDLANRIYQTDLNSHALEQNMYKIINIDWENMITSRERLNKVEHPQASSQISLNEVNKALSQANVDYTIQRAVSEWLRNNYMAENTMEMPTREPGFAELEAALAGVLPSSSVGITARALLQIIRVLLRR